MFFFFLKESLTFMGRGDYCFRPRRSDCSLLLGERWCSVPCLLITKSNARQNTTQYFKVAQLCTMLALWHFYLLQAWAKREAVTFVFPPWLFGGWGPWPFREPSSLEHRGRPPAL